MPGIVLDNITKVYKGDVKAVDDVSLRIEDGEFLVLVGPSGCGKSTLLRMVAGLEQVTEGTISIGDRDVTDLAPRERDVAMVFQSYALYPHMTVRDNLGYGLRVRRTPKPEIAKRVQEVAEVLGLDQFLDRRPAALSGGQRQRVAMGRAMVREPQAFLMDEPLSNLDAKLRVSMRTQLAALHARLRTTTIYVTHDQIEAMTLGQRVAVLRDGQIQQVDTPDALYASPANLFVAAFIGSPAMNLVQADVSGGELRFGGYTIPLGADAGAGAGAGVGAGLGGGVGAGVGAGAPAEGRVIAGMRPEAFEDSEFAEAAMPRLDVQVEVVEKLGADTHVMFTVASPPVDVGRVHEEADDEHGLVEIAGTLFTARVDPRTEARPGRPLQLAVNPAAIHYFDPTTGLRLDGAPQLAAAASS